MNGPAVTWVELFTWLFLLANAGRFLAYAPQILAAWQCEAGARSVSLLTWSYFAFAHLTALLYAIFVLQDSKSVWIFSGNLFFTLLLVAMLVFKRLQHRRGARRAPSFAHASRLPRRRQVVAATQTMQKHPYLDARHQPLCHAGLDPASSARLHWIAEQVRNDKY
jgi:hypothetical protein